MFFNLVLLTITIGPHIISSVIDLEAQQVAQAAPRAHMEGAETHDILGLWPHSSSIASSLRSMSTGQATGPILSEEEDINDEAQSFISQAEGSGRSDVPEMNTDQSRSSGDDNGTSDRLTSHAEAHIQPATPSNPTVYSSPRITTSDLASERKFKSHDDARTNTPKDNRDNIVIFAGLFSAILTSFVIETRQNLNPSPADETAYNFPHHSIILPKTSLQLPSISPWVSVPPAQPHPYHAASDFRAKYLWLMALLCALLATLLATLIQQWVRYYTHVSQLYRNPLRSPRLRQYLCEGWCQYMSIKAVLGLVHISLFLFFAGLGGSILNSNTKVALNTIVPICIGGLPYIFKISLCHNPFPGIFWFLFRKSRGRRFRDCGSNGEVKSVCANTAQGQIHDRDERAIRWLFDNLMEDTEMEQFLTATPDSFNKDWGAEIWKRVGKHEESGDQSQPHMDKTTHRPSSSWSIRSILSQIIHLVKKPAPRHPPTHVTTCPPVPHPPNAHSFTVHIQGENVVHKLSTSVARSLETCKNRLLFSNNDGLWRERIRVCIEATASLVCCANAKLAWFGGISELLGDIGSFEKIRELSLSGTDELFVMRWTCLSLVAIRQILTDNRRVQFWAGWTMGWFAEEDETGNSDALGAVQKINETVQKASDCLFRLYDALCGTEDLTEQVIEILRGRESQISELEQINIEADSHQPIDDWISVMQNVINNDSHQIISQFPGVLDDLGRFSQTPIPFSRFLELSRDPRKLQFIRPGQALKSISSPALTLRDILEGQGDADAYKELLKSLKEFHNLSRWHGDEMPRQLLRLHDLRDGGGLGFTVELFFLALSQLLSTYPSNESQSALYAGTFRAITSDWSKHKDSLGTQNLLLDTAMSRREEFDDHYPAYIVDEFLLLLANIFEGQKDPHIRRARQQFESFELYGSRRFRERVLRVLTWGQAQTLAS